MKSLSEIIVGVDFSSISVEAFHTVVAIARREKARIRLIYAHDAPLPWSAFENDAMVRHEQSWLSLTSELRRSFQEKLDELKASAGKDVEITSSIVDGEAEDVLVESGDRSKGTLVVVGHKGSSAVERLFLGSVAENVVTRSRAPVLVTKAALEEEGFQQIMLAASLNPSTEDQLSWARRLAGAGAALDLVHATESRFVSLASAGDAAWVQSLKLEMEQETGVRMSKLAGDSDREQELTIKPVKLSQNPRDALSEHWEASQPDLVVIGSTYGQRKMGSLAIWALRHAPCSVLVVPHEETED